MSKEVIDEKVVEMQFDNRQFEKNVKESMSTLDKLKEKLKLKGAAKAAESEFEAYKSGFISVKDSINKMWATWEYDIAHKMKNVVKMFTIDPIKTGLSEYETQLNAIQTILANTESKGTTLDEVNAALNTLNEYADKTIYNFTEMTKNIGTFTAAGIDLDTSVNAIQGIANLAAVSGSTSQQASTAMYQLSQALASGTVKLMDWNSVVNAGMGGQVFQDALKETARVHGIAIDDMIKSQGSFRETLKEGWLTSEILTETLQKFTLGTEGLTEEQIEQNRVMLRAKGYTEEQIEEIFKLGNTATNAATKVKTFTQLLDTLKESAQSGWSQTWSIIIGDFEEAKELWTNVSNVLGGIIGASAEARNNLLRGGLDTGWDKFMSAGIMDEESFMFHFKKIASEYEVDIDKMIEEEGSLEKALVRGFSEGTISSEMFAEALDRLTDAYENCSDEELANHGYTRAQLEAMIKLNSQLQNGEISIEEFTEAMSKLSGRTLIIESLSNLFKGFLNIINPIKEAFREFFPATTSDQLYNLIDAFHELTENFKNFTEKNGDKIKRTFRGIFAVLDIGVSIIKIFAKAIGRIIGALTGPLTGGFLTVTASIGDFLVSIQKAFDASTGLEDFANSIADTFINIVNAIKTFYAAAKEKIQTSGFDGFLNTLKGIWNFVKSLITAILDLFGSLGAGIADTLTGSGIGTVIDLLNAGLITTLLVKFKGMFDGVKDITDKFGEILDSVTGSLEAFQNKLKADTIKTIAVSVAILAASILVLSFIDQEKLEKSLSAITLLFAVLMGSMSIITKVGTLGKTAVSTGMLIGIAASLLLLSFALVRLGKMTDDGMVRGLVTMTTALAVMVGALHWLSVINGRKKMVTEGSKQMLKIAWMLIVLSAALKILATMSWEDYGKAMAAMGGSLAIMVGSLTILSLINGKDTKMASKGASEMMKMAKMLIVLGLAFKLIATMSWEDIGKGAAVLIGGLLALTLALKVMQKTDGMLANSSKKDKNSKQSAKVMISKAGQFTAMAAALGILALALIVIAKMDWDEILRGLGTIVLVIGVLELALWSLNKIEAKDTAPKMSSLLALSGGLLLLSINLKILGSMKWSTIAKGLVAMVETLAVLAAALKIISKFQSTGKGAGSLAGIAGSLMLLALAIGMLSSVMIMAGKANFTDTLKGFATMALVFAAVAIGAKLLAPVVGTLITFAGGLALLGAACMAAGIGIYLLAAGLSLVSASLGEAIKTLCQVLIDSAGMIGKAAAALIIGLIDGLVDVSDELVSGVLEILLNTLKSLNEFVPEIADSLMELIINVANKLIEYIPAIVELAGKILEKIFGSIGDAISDVDAGALMPIITTITVITLSMKELAKAKKYAKDAIVGALAVSAVMIEFALALTAIAALTLIPGVSDALSGGSGLIQALLGATAIISVITLLMPKLQAVGAAVMAGGFLASIGAISAAVAAISIVILEIIAFMAILGGLEALTGISSAVSKAGDLLQALGEAIGQFVGGIIGGIGKGVTKSLVKMAEDLSEFGVKIQPFLTSIKSIDAEVFKSVANLVALILAISAADLLESIIRFLNFGQDPFESFSDNLNTFAEAIVKFSSTVTGNINTAAIDTATDAGTKLAEMASKIPTNGGLWQALAGGQNLDIFGAQLVSFAIGLVGFSAIVSGTSFNNVETAAIAGERLAKMASTIPVNGGLWQALAGGQDVGIFGNQILHFAIGLAGFANVISGASFNNIEAAAVAGERLAKMASIIPVNGGLWQAIAGGQDIGLFGKQILYFAAGLAGFAAIVNTCSFNNVETATAAGERLAKMASTLPVSGGLWQYIAGGQSLALFGAEVLIFGAAISGFASKVNTTSFDQVDNASLAGERLAKMAATIPTNGLGAAWDMASFKGQIQNFGDGIAYFVSAVADSNFSNVVPAVTAGIALVPLCKMIPEEGLLKGNKKNMESFKEQIILFGEGISGFCSSTASANFTNAISAVTAGVSLVTLAKLLPNFIGAFGKDKGSENMKSFKEQIILFGEGISGFKTSIGDANFANAVIAAAAGVEIAKIASTISTGNMGDLNKFSTNLPLLGTAIKDFSTTVNQVKISELIETLSKLAIFFTTLNTVIKNGLSSMINTISSASTNLNSVITGMLNNMVSALVSGSIPENFSNAGILYMAHLIMGVASAKDTVVNSFTGTVSAALTAINSSSYWINFYNTGSYLMGGLAEGIEDNGSKAVKAAEKIAKAVNTAIRSIWRVNSPSKEAYETSEFYIAGMVNSLTDGEEEVYSSASGVAEMAVKGMSSTLAKINSLIENGIDTQPTIKPVLDLSEVNAGVGVLDNMLGVTPSVGVLSRVNSISAAMNKNQNGQNDDIISAINGLSNKLDNVSGDTFNINGVTYDNGSELQSAIELIIRAANIERRK